MDNTKATFEGIRENIIEYLSAKPAFKDYNFTAPAISTLIDALAYTSHYLVRYANFSLNECFLDSAQLRNSVVSHAKEIGYIPHQYKAARAKVRLKTKSQQLSMDGRSVGKNTLFTATNYETMKSYTFRTTELFPFKMDDEGYWYADVDIVEGVFVTENFKQDEYYTSKYYLINERVDTDYMTVIVDEPTEKEGPVQYKRAVDISSFDDTANIYYLYEAYNGKIEVAFGDGKLSHKIEPFSKIKVIYLVTNGSEANNIKSFVLSETIGDMNSEDFTLEVLVPSESGGERESVESIRFNAPKFYQSQDRAVTTSDYNSLLLNKFGNIVDSVVTWGGEEETPPRYGTVFLSVRPRKQELLTHTQSNEIIKYLKTKNLPCIDIELVDPSYIDVDMNVRIDWNMYKTTLDKSDLTKLVESASKTAFTMYTTSFKSKFLYSKFVSEINALDNSIESVLTDFVLKQYIYPDKNINLMTFYNFEFHNEIEPGSVFVERWNEYRNSSYTYSISDMNEDGILWLSQTDGTITKNSILGKVDYANGVVSIDNYHFNNVANKSKLAVQCKPVLNNLYVVKRHLLRLNELNVEISEI